jgi:ATP-dependent Clp protease ATP-binding subunit ClpC
MVDIGTMKQSHDVSMLLGAPPGFLGHDRPTPLVRFLTSHDHGVVVFDNVDAAHPDVQHLVMESIEGGNFPDPRRATLSLDRFVVILGRRNRASAHRTVIGFQGPHGSTLASAGSSRSMPPGGGVPLAPEWTDLGLDAEIELSS